MQQAAQSVNGPSNRSATYSVKGYRQRTGFTVFSSAIHISSSDGLLELIQGVASVSTKRQSRTHAIAVSDSLSLQSRSIVLLVQVLMSWCYTV
jgi:hypothetical protein